MLKVYDCFKVGRIYGISVTINRNIFLSYRYGQLFVLTVFLSISKLESKNGN